MRNQMLAAWLLGCAVGTGQEPAPAPEAAQVVEIPNVEAAIPDPVKALGKPEMMDFPHGIQMAVTAATDSAQAHVNQGLNQLHGGWEFEASRHFAAAMREDPECLLAHWGMVMSLLSPSPETGLARNAASERLLHLLDQGKGSDLERAYAYGLIKYIEAGPAEAASAFSKVARNFPNDIQAAIFSALFGRGGYGELGSATPDQETAEKNLEAMVAEDPENPLPLNALLTIRAEAPDLTASLDLARKLASMSPEYPPYAHLLGHYEWRCGNHGRAVAAFALSTSLYDKWMKRDKVSFADCPEWVRSECYRIVATLSKGDFDSAYADSRKLAGTELDRKRLASPGSRMLLWNAKTLPARILLQRGKIGNATEALQSLPNPKEIKDTHAASLAYWWMDGLRFSLEAQRLINEKDLDGARDVVAALTLHGESMAKTQAASTVLGERSSWGSAFRALEVLASALRGKITMDGPKNRMGTAYNWFASATDRQRPAAMMVPPMVLSPMAIHLGEYYLAAGKPIDAVEAYERALAAFPNDMNALVGLKNAAEKAKLSDKAKAAAILIEKLKAAE